jgi:hypothetical protein
LAQDQTHYSSELSAQVCDQKRRLFAELSAQDPMTKRFVDILNSALPNGRRKRLLKQLWKNLAGMFCAGVVKSCVIVKLTPLENVGDLPNGVLCNNVFAGCLPTS